MRSLLIHPNYYKKIFTFFSPGIRMSGKNIYFEGKKIKKVIFTEIRKYSRYMTFMLTKYQVQKKNLMVQVSQLNSSLDIMMMILLENYV